MVIAGSVNNDFEPLEINGPTVRRDGEPTGRESGRGWPISRGRVGALHFCYGNWRRELSPSSVVWSLSRNELRPSFVVFVLGGFKVLVFGVGLG